MRPILTIVDDFLDNPDEIRYDVLRQGFTDEFFEGTKYEDVNILTRPPEIHDKLEQLFGGPIQMQVQAFRLNRANSQLHSLVHADNSCASLAGVLYLNLPDDCRGGTAFWRHRATGLDRQPTQQELDHFGYTIEEFCAERNDRDAWERLMVCPMRYNRLVVYPTVQFHSRWPWEAFGDDPEHARLIGAFFFDVLK